MLHARQTGHAGRLSPVLIFCCIVTVVAAAAARSLPTHPSWMCVPLQDVARKAGIPAFDFVKIDIEGAEGQVRNAIIVFASLCELL